MTKLKKPQILGFIPARGGSKGIPRKNLVPVAGKPLISYTFEQALLSTKLTRIVLSTDDAEIANLGNSYGIEVPYLRPEEISGDSVPIEAALIHALNWLSDNQGYRPDIFAILQPTTPLRTAKHIDEAICLLERSGLDAVVSVSPPREHPSEMVYFEDKIMQFVLKGAGYAFGEQRQDYVECYFVNGAVYATLTKAFQRTGSRFGETTIPYVMKALESIDIDTEDDRMTAELMISA